MRAPHQTHHSEVPVLFKDINTKTKKTARERGAGGGDGEERKERKEHKKRYI